MLRSGTLPGSVETSVASDSGQLATKPAGRPERLVFADTPLPLVDQWSPGLLED
jgi:hypothetical protein